MTEKTLWGIMIGLIAFMMHVVIFIAFDETRDLKTVYFKSIYKEQKLSPEAFLVRRREVVHYIDLDLQKHADVMPKSYYNETVNKFNRENTE